MHHIFSNRTTRRALTLTELLVALFIVFLLAALLVTGIRYTTEKAQGARCVGNLRNIAVAILNYTTDNEGYFPPYSLHTPSADNFGQENRWPTLFYDSLGREAFRCGSLKNVSISAIGQHISYGYNAYHLGSVQRGRFGSDQWVDDHNRKTTHVSEVVDPTHTLMLAETLITSGTFANEAGFYIANHWPNPGTLRVDARHGSGVLVAWVDGRVSMEPLTEDQALPREYFTLEKD